MSERVILSKEKKKDHVTYIKRMSDNPHPIENVAIEGAMVIFEGIDT